MATIPVQATGLRHVRKTVAFDGTAGNGAVGTIPVFSCTGWVLGLYGFGRCTEDIVAAALTTLSLGLAGAAGWLGTAAGNDSSDARDLEAGDGFQSGYAGFDAVNVFFSGAFSPIGQDIFLTTDVQITAGTLVFEAWYLPATDDGALAGDDIDLELGAYLAGKVLDEALSGHTTAGSAGKAIADIETDVDAVLVDTSTTLQAELDGIQADTEDIQTRLPAALVGGRIDATIDATGMETGAIDALLTRQMTEAYAADGAAPTLAQALFEIVQFLTEKNLAGTTLTIKKRDGATAAMTFTLNDATNPASITRAT